MISLKEITLAAQEIGCDVATVQACEEVESGRAGFYKSGKIVLKFEGHIFHQYTHGKYDKTHPHISYPAWTEMYSQFGEAAYLRFDEAFDLDPKAALLSTSWGSFQIMGDNYGECGCKSVDEFITWLKIDEDNHLEAFVRYCKSRKLCGYLASQSWAAYAYRYNGPSYIKNDYATKLRQAYGKYAARQAAA